jgi:peptide/nickel transport system permease protein
MARVTFGRLLLLFPTLVGVTLLTFALLVLAPPPEGPEAAEHARALFLDRPLFLAVDPPDLGAAVEAGLEAARTGVAPPDLGGRGAVLIPLLVPRLGALGPRARAWALAQLAPLAARFLSPERLEAVAGTDELALWGEIFEERRLDFRDTHVRRLVRRLAAGRSRHAPEQLRALGTFTLPVLFETLSETRDPDARERLLALLRDVVPEAPAARLSPTDPRALAAWDEWWFVHRLDYVVLGPIERRVAVVTEARYGRWVARLLTLRLGTSMRDGRPIVDKLTARGGVTLALAALAATVAFVLAVPLGLAGAMRRGSRFDRWLTSGAFVLYALPVVWVGTLLSRALCGPPGLSVFPAGGLVSSGAEAAGPLALGLDVAWHLVLPVACLAYPSLIVLSRHQRSAALEVIGADYVRTARAKGVPELQVVRRHVLRNALLPVVTLVGMELPLLLGSTVIVEEVFALPGLGRETLAAVAARDVPWLVAVTAATCVLSAVGLLATDLAHAVIDPRVRLPVLSSDTSARDGSETHRRQRQTPGRRRSTPAAGGSEDAP